MRTFCCTAYVHVNPEKRDKLDAKAVKCYFIGYGSDLFGYRFWDEKNRKILRHCDVTFDESVLYKDREQKVIEITKQVGVEVELENSNPVMSKQILNQLVLKNLKWSKLHLSRC